MYLVIFQCDSADCHDTLGLNSVLERSDTGYMTFVNTIEEANEAAKTFLENIPYYEDENYTQAQIFSINHEGVIEAQKECIANFYPNKK
jgi:hypothetical protein